MRYMVCDMCCCHAMRSMGLMTRDALHVPSDERIVMAPSRDLRLLPNAQPHQQHSCRDAPE